MNCGEWVAGSVTKLLAVVEHQPRRRHKDERVNRRGLIYIRVMFGL
jgi:hypothetical protein